MNTFSKNQVWLFHINEIMQNVIFGNQNLSLHMFSRFICGLAYVSTSLIFVTKSYSILWMYITFYLSIHQLMEIWAVFSFEQCYCKQLCTNLCINMFIAFKYIPRSRVAEHIVTLFNFLENQLHHFIAVSICLIYCIAYILHA